MVQLLLIQYCLYVDWHQRILKEFLKMLQLRISVKSQNADKNSEENWKTTIIFSKSYKESPLIIFQQEDSINAPNTCIVYKVFN